MNSNLSATSFRDASPVPSYTSEGVFSLHVNHDVPVSQLLSAGHYDWNEQEINEKNFPPVAKNPIDIEIALVSFGRAMRSEEISAALLHRHIRPATLQELLTFGATYPEKQLEFPIAGLGSAWRDNNGTIRVPYLSTSPGKKRHCWLWEYETWFGVFRFAAVRAEKITR